MRDPTPIQPEQLCRDCGDPLNLRELRDGICCDCDEAQFQRDRRAAWESHQEDLAELAAMDREEFGR